MLKPTIYPHLPLSEDSLGTGAKASFGLVLLQRLGAAAISLLLPGRPGALSAARGLRGAARREGWGPRGHVNVGGW